MFSIDINECTNGTHLCEHNYYNTNGSYVCDCQPGYQLSNELSCSDLNECDNNNGGCDHTCINKSGRYQCQCDIGFKINTNGKICTGNQLIIYFKFFN